VTTTNLIYRLQERWDRRSEANRDGREPLAVQSTVEICRPAQEVWDFVTCPDAAVVLDHHHVRTMVVPGTPEGVGQQYCSLRMEGTGRMTATVSEVVEYQPPHRFVAKTLTGPSEVLEVVVISPTATGCTYTTTVNMRIAYGTSRKVTPAVQLAVDEQAAKVRSIVESGVRIGAASQTPKAQDDVGGSEAATSDAVVPPGTTVPGSSSTPGSDPGMTGMAEGEGDTGAIWSAPPLA
jgi:hypothetical protein